MDAKNLAVLQKLKDKMGVQDVPDPVFTPHAISLLRELAESLKGPQKTSKPKSKSKKRKPKSPQPISAATARRRQSEELRQVKKTREQLSADKALAAQYRDCRQCGKPVFIGQEIPITPICCSRCRRHDEEIDLGIKPKNGNEFSSVKVLPGGAPGLGKRK